MSTTAEYYIRNMSVAEVEGLFHRLESRNRAETLDALRAEMNRGLDHALAGERRARTRETSALREGVERLRSQMEERAACNERLTASLQDRLEDFRRQGAELHARAERAIGRLQEETGALRRHVAETRERVLRVEERTAILERTAVDERARRDEEGRRVAGHSGGLLRVTRALLDLVSPGEAQRLGLGELRERVTSALAHAKEHAAAAAGQAEAATLAAAHRSATELVEQRDARADEEGAAQAAIGLALAASRARLRELGLADVRRFLGAELDRHAAEARALGEAIAPGSRSWAERKAVLDDARGRAAALDRATGTLHARYEELVEKATAREAVLRGLVEALVETWGAEFEMDVDYAVKGDARSAVVFRTKRGPFAPNVQATLGIDGRMEVHFTGYRGTECVGDLDAVKQALRRGGAVKLVDGASKVEPDRPNPPDAGPARLAPVRLVSSSEPVGDVGRWRR